ncbi:ASCH domain-containing protein [Flavobacterium sp. UMI-01]|uniref:ASCH domain-containing protein n=1 Tax=Flavobacterium sp. UMI-01 TaxID=1441053 RepID=UPI001C7CCC92|nr:ASCH domain-containing protein [Flavobacterium sp. UMI-01]GIZ08354.1 hypothetical protein FUMI01_10810 [Flavobacterium sp. UMI-01]
MMKALSIKQPWASLIAHGIKDIENRTWKTHFRGRIYIHASASGMTVCFDGEQREVLKQLEKPIDITPLSAIIGEVEIIDCVINHPSIWAEKTDFSQEDPTTIWNWVLSNPVLYEKPILNVKGKLSFWEPDIDIVECIGCKGKFNYEEMKQDESEENFCTKCWEEMSPVMIKETKECNDRDKLSEFGKVVTVKQSDNDFEFLIRDGFSQKFDNTMACMKVCLEIAKGYSYVKKCITEDNKFHLILTKEIKSYDSSC